MPEVDFYVLADNATPERFACALSNKIIKQGLSIYIHTRDRQAADQLDQLLWTFKDISFVPHTLADDTLDEETPIRLGWNGTSPDSHEVIINLDTDIPECVESFDRIIEIVVADTSSRDRSREHYKEYKKRGYAIRNHDLK